MNKLLVLLTLIILSHPLCGQSLSELYASVSPSVVVIETKEKIEDANGQTSYLHSKGSGVLISAQGEILTAAHVVNNAEHINVIFHDGKRYPAKVVRLAAVADVALIELVYYDNQYNVAAMGDSDEVAIGHDIFVIGAPFGIEYSLSRGIVSGKSVEKTRMEGFTYAEFFQTDAAINHGNSGGPMFNMKGEVIGLVSSIVTESGGFDGIGFAATINVTKRLVIDSDRRRWTGISGVLVSGELARILNVPQQGGFLIEDVVALSPAFMADLKGGNAPFYSGGEEIRLGGDIILAVNDIPIISEKNIITLFKSVILTGEQSHKAFRLKILRAGKVREVTMTFPD